MAGNQQLVLNPRQNSYLSLLDEKSIGKICEYLSLLDLLQFSELDVNYQRLIGEKIISKRWFNICRFKNHYDVRKAFKQFGEFAKKLCIHESDIQYKDDKFTLAEEMFRLIKRYCVAEKLNSVNIGFDDESLKLDANVFLDVFSKLKSLKISMPTKQKKIKRNDSLGELLKKLLANCTALQKLELFGVQNLSDDNNTLDFLMIPQMFHLKSLWFDRCKIPHGSWLKFIAAGVRPLKSLRFESSSFRTFQVYYTFQNISRKIEHYAYLNQREFIEQIVKAFPCLDTFAIEHDGWETSDPNCEALMKLQHLKELCILEPEYSNLIESIARMDDNGSRPCPVQKLAFKLAGEIHQVNLLSILNLTNLQAVVFVEPKTQHVAVYKQFLKLPQLTQIILKNEHRFHDRDIDDLRLVVKGIVESTEHVQVLKVLTDIGILSKQFYRSLVKLRSQHFPRAAPLHLCAKFNRIKKEETFPKVIEICDFFDCRFFS